MIIEIYNKVKNTYDVIYNIIIYIYIYIYIFIYIYTYIIKHGIDMKYKDKTSYKMNIKHIILIFATFQ